MAPLPPVPGVARTELLYSWDGQTVENVWYNGGADDTIATLTDIAFEMMTRWREDIMPHVSEYVTLLRAEVKYLGVVNGNEVTIPAQSNSNGEETSPSMPNNVTVAVKLTTGLGGRGRRGRKYHIGLCENQCEFSHLVPAFQTTLQGRYETWVGLQIETDHPIVVVSYYINNLVRPNPQVTPVTNVSLDAVLDSQRRRLPGRGN